MRVLKHDFSTEIKRSLDVRSLGARNNQAMLDDATQIGERLRRRMREKRITNKKLADETGVTEQAVGLWLKTGQIARDRLPAIAKCLDKTVDWILTGGETTERGDRWNPEISDNVPDDIRQFIKDILSSYEEDPEEVRRIARAFKIFLKKDVA